MAFQEQPLPTFVPTVAHLSTARARTINGGTVQTAGYDSPGDGGGDIYVYHTTGRSLVTVDGGFFIAGSRADDYYEAKDRSVADIRKFRVLPTRTAAQNTAALQAAVNAARRVFVPEETDIEIDDTITLPDFTVIEGKGDESKITLTSPATDMFVAGEGCQFKGLHLIGPNSSDVSVSLTGNAIKVGDVANVTISDCIIEQWAWSGIYAQQAYNLTIKNNILFANLNAQTVSADILVYQASNNGRMVIDGNLCLSNNGQGISLNGIGGSGKVVCVNNIIITLDPATCIPGGTWEEIDPEDSLRQHGIIVGYANDVSDILIANNIIQNTDWTGIYKPGTSNGPMLIANNICRNNGYDLISAQTITGGIYVAASGGESIVGNQIFNYKGNQGAINMQVASPNAMPVLISDNTIADSLGNGILLGGRSSNVSVKGNMIYGSALIDISIGPVAGISGLTEHTIENNTLYRKNTAYPSLYFDRQASTELVTIKNNRFAGFDKTVNTANQFNCAIYHTSTEKNVEIVGNVISNYYIGVHHAAYWTGRITDYHLSYNHFDDCTYGIVLNAGTTAPAVFLEGNTYRDVGTKHGAVIGEAVSIDAKIFDTNVQLYRSAKPTTGTWVIGDVVYNSAPGAGGPLGWLCTVAGNPGTWIRLGTLDDGVQTINDEDEALVLDRRKTVVYLNDLTADRLVTLPSDSSAPEGDSITIRRAAGGAFDLTVDALAVLDRDEWVKVKHDGSGYVIDSSSTPLTKVWSKITTDPALDIWLNGDANLDTTGDADNIQGSPDATWAGTAAYTTKPPAGSVGSKAFDLEGTNTYLSLPSADTSFTNNFSVACWYKQVDGDFRVFSKMSNVETGYELYVDDFILYFKANNELFYIASPVIAPDTWYHFAVSINGASSGIYINGVRRNIGLTGSPNFNPTISTNALDLRLGAWAQAINPPVPLEGQISDFMFFSKALAPHEAKVLALGP